MTASLSKCDCPAGDGRHERRSFFVATGLFDILCKAIAGQRAAGPLALTGGRW
jgi:hypothetical protein